MFSPNKNRLPHSTPPKKPISRKAKKQLFYIILLTIVFMFLYFTLTSLDGLIYPTMIIYMVAFAALLIAYIIYNRAFYGKDITVEMLPEDWDEEKKQNFVDGYRIRLEKSRWMLTFIIPLTFVFMAEMLYLFVWDGWLSNLFK